MRSRRPDHDEIFKERTSHLTTTYYPPIPFIQSSKESKLLAIEYTNTRDNTTGSS